MHHLEIDWLEFARRVVTWQALTPKTRRNLLDHNASEHWSFLALGADLDRLVEQRFVTVSGGSRVMLHPTHRPFARALRAMSRHDIHGKPKSRTLIGYLHDHYTAEERRKLQEYMGRSYWSDNLTELARRISSVTWLEPALAPHATGRSEDNVRQRSPLAGEDGEREAAGLVQLLLERGGVLPVAELPCVLPAERVAVAVNAALRSVWVLAMLRGEEHEPVLALWPPLVTRLLRPAAVLPSGQPVIEQTSQFVMVDDAVAVLVAAIAEPLRLRSNGSGLFAKAAERITHALAEPHTLLKPLCDWDREIRLQAAVHMLSTLDYLRVAGRAGRDLRLEPAPAGRDWLAAPIDQRAFAFIDAVRCAGWQPEATRGSKVTLRSATGPPHPHELDHDGPDDDELDYADLDDDFWLEDLAGAAAGTDYGRQIQLLPRSIYPPDLKRRVLDEVARAYSSIPQTEAVALEEFVNYWARAHNPLKDFERIGQIGALFLPHASDEELERQWSTFLVHVLINWLVPLGGVRVARLSHDRVGIALTQCGRYMLGLTDTFDPSALTAGATAATDTRIIVQPNFEVVFLAPSPLAEAEIGRFAERLGTGVGTLFRLTRDAALNAAAAGITADQALATLHEFSRQSVPANVAHELNGWFHACRRVQASFTLLIRCSDEETTTRVIAAAGTHVRRVNPTTLELIRPDQQAALARKLRKQGVFLDAAEELPAHARRIRSRRSRT